MGRQICIAHSACGGGRLIFRETKLKGAFVIDVEPIEDERGLFARSWCHKEFSAQGLNSKLVQCNISFNKKKGTLRGMHYQKPPHEEVKLVRCTQGAIYDVIVDLRSSSPTHAQWVAEELTARNRRMLYVPTGFAHGFVTLTDDAEVFYHMSEFYDAQSACGVRWDDFKFNITWPEQPLHLSERDRSYPDFGV